MNDTEDTIIVTGGAGFIGSNLIKKVALIVVGLHKHRFVRLLCQW